MAASVLTVGLLHQSGLFGDILNGLMFLAYLSDELLWRLVVLDYAGSLTAFSIAGTSAFVTSPGTPAGAKKPNQTPRSFWR